MGDATRPLVVARLPKVPRQRSQPQAFRVELAGDARPVLDERRHPDRQRRPDARRDQRFLGCFLRRGRVVPGRPLGPDQVAERVVVAFGALDGPPRP